MMGASPASGIPNNIPQQRRFLNPNDMNMIGNGHNGYMNGMDPNLSMMGYNQYNPGMINN